MLTIENWESIKSKEFHWEGRAWILYGVDVSNTEYKFIFMPKDSIADVYVIQKAQLVLLNRTKHNRRGYRLWTTDGKHTYLNTKDIKNWVSFVQRVFTNRMITI